MGLSRNLEAAAMARNLHPYYLSSQKRAFDVALSAILLLLLSPFLLLISLAVYVTVGRPVLFRQQRTGFMKRSFTMFKFRTMKPGAEIQRQKYEHMNQAPYPMFKIFEDPRFVGVGKWLSQSGFDELPQLLNIFRGEMSFIGPRPLPVNEAKQLGADWDFRYAVKPGIFSYWTLSKNRHKSLTIWKKLEQQTLKEGGLGFELGVIQQLFVAEFQQLHKLFQRRV